jgi:hypothetical protein
MPALIRLGFVNDSPQLLANHDVTSRIHSMSLEYVLCQIEADRRNLHVDSPLGSSGR